MATTVVLVEPDDSGVVTASTSQVVFFTTPAIGVVSFPDPADRPIVASSDTVVLFPESPSPSSVVTVSPDEERALVARSDTVVAFPVPTEPLAVVLPQPDAPTIVAVAEQGPPGPQGPPGADGADTAVSTWIEYVANWAAPPTLIGSVAQGDVWEYTYTGGGVLYRVISADPYADAFYTTFDGSTATGLVTERSMAAA